MNLLRQIRVWVISLTIISIAGLKKTNAQDSVLTLKAAIETALENNYDIRIQKNITEQNKNNNSAGNAGMLPQVDASGSYTKSDNSLLQKYNTGAEVNRKNAGSTNINGDVGAEWTVFDGLKMFYTKNRLSQLYLQSEEQLKIRIENSLQDVIAAYFTMVRNHQLLKSMREEIALSEERVKISDRKLNNGSGSRLDWLQAKTEYNRQKALELQLVSNAESARLALNRLLGRNIEMKFDVEDTVIISYIPVYDDLKRTVQDNNSTLNYYRYQKKISELALKENRSLRFPIVGVNAHYTYSKTTNDAGLTLFNRINGFNYGATSTIPLFHGLNINRQIKNAKLDAINSGLEYDLQSIQVNESLMNAFREFTYNMQLLKIEEENITYAKEVLTVAQERYRVGVSNAVEQREAQQTFEDAMTRLADARYNAKISETNLKRLNGELVH